MVAGCDCGRSHELADAALIDARAHPDVVVRSDARAVDAASFDAGECPMFEGVVRVTVTQVGDEPCDGEAIAGRLSSVEIDRDADAVRLAVDLCPDADADCRCLVEAIGVDTSSYAWSAIEPGPFHAEVGPTMLLLWATQSGGEAGLYEDVLTAFARDAYLDWPEYELAGVAAGSLEDCRTPAGDSAVGPCHHIRYAARVRIDASVAGWEGTGGEVVVEEGEAAFVPGTFATVRLTRAHESYCGPAGSPAPPSPEAAFVITWSFPPAP